MEIDKILLNVCSDAEAISAIVTLLAKNGIRLRDAAHNTLMQINVSIPTSIVDAYVIGLRYLKDDNTQTEDHFLIRKDRTKTKIEYYPKGDLEKFLKEYKNTHKAQVNFPVVQTAVSTLEDQCRHITDVRTCSFLK